MFSVSIETLNRLPAYLTLLEQGQEAGLVATTVPRLARGLSLPQDQVEKDLAALGIKEVPPIATLLTAIRHFLSWDNCQEAFLVGDGTLGRAMLDYEGFPQYGIRIAATFSPEPTGEEFPLSKLVSLARRMHVHLGIVAVAPEQAQAIADRMVEGGIQGILNFAPCPINVPDGVWVQNENLAAGLARLREHLHPIAGGSGNN